MLIGCALYVDILKPPSLLSLTLQDMLQDIVLSIKHILKTSKTLKQLAGLDPLQWPTIKLVINRIKDENGTKEYQGASLQGYSTRMLECCRDCALRDLKCLDEKMRDRLEWSDVKLLRSILVFIDTQGWQTKTRIPSDTSEVDSDETEVVDDVMAEIQSAVEFVASVFREPLQAKNVVLSTLHDEVEEVVEHARTYLAIHKEGYRKVWYKLNTSPDAIKWPNVLLLSKLLFSLPFSSGTVERMFSALKLIKTDRRTNLHVSTLDDLLEINIEGPALDNFSPDEAIDSWWKACSTGRRVNQQPRKPYRPRNSTAQSSTTSSSTTDEEPEETLESLTLSDWDMWFDKS